MNLGKVWLIIKREFTVSLRRRSFLFTVFGMPLFFVGIMLLVGAVTAQTSENVSGFTNIGVVDEANILGSTTAPKPFQLIATVEEAKSAMAAGQIQGYYVVPTDFMTMRIGTVEAYYRQDLAFNDGLLEDLHDWIHKALATSLQSPELVERLTSPLEEMQYYQTSNPTRPVDEGGLFVAIIVPFVLSFLTYMLILTSSQFVMSGLAEEKENRMMEMFITSARPSEMLWGKLIGMLLLSLLQVFIWAGYALLASLLAGSFRLERALAAIQLSPSMLLTVMLFVLLGYFFYGSIMAAIGALANAEQEGRQIASLLGLVCLSPIMFSIAFILEPNGPLATFISIFPFTAPVGMSLRMGLAQVPQEQVIGALLILLISTAVIMFVAAKLFRFGMLQYGKRPSLKTLIGVVFSRGTMANTPSQPATEVQ
jgi:ABC-2 type transport system permease protein